MSRYYGRAKSAALFVLDPIVIAWVFRIAAPPFRGDPFRSLIACDVMQNPAPAEQYRRAVSAFSDSFDLFRGRKSRRGRGVSVSRWSVWIG